MKFSHNELFAHKHLFIVVIVVFLCMLTVGIFLQAYVLTRNQITTNYRQTFEKKTWSELEVFHQASRVLIENFANNKDYNFQFFTNSLVDIPTFEAFDFIVTDVQGNVLNSGGDGAHQGENISQRDTVIEQLIRTQEDVTDETINWQNKRVFAKGSAITTGDGTTLLYVSSYEKAQFDADLVLLQQKVVDIYARLLYRILMFGIPSLILIIIILKRHDAVAHHHYHT